MKTKGNSKEKTETQLLIEAAVQAAVEACLKGIDEKIQAAVNLGAQVGAATGAEIGVAAAVKAVERERKKFREAQRDKRFHNTKLLLRHYRALNEHYKHAVFDVSSAEAESEDFADIMQAMNTTMSDEELYVESIKQSCVRTKVIMAHVNKMLDIYEIMCEKSSRDEDKRRWRVLSGMYLEENGRAAGALAQEEHIDKRTVYKDIDICVDDLTTLLFGIGGLETS